MESAASKTLIKIVDMLGCIFLTLFSGMFWLFSISALVVSVVDHDIISVALCITTAALGWICWSIRKPRRS